MTDTPVSTPKSCRSKTEFGFVKRCDQLASVKVLVDAQLLLYIFE